MGEFNNLKGFNNLIFSGIDFIVVFEKIELLKKVNFLILNCWLVLMFLLMFFVLKIKLFGFRFFFIDFF